MQDEWMCAIAWMPVLQVENAQKTIGTQDAVIKLRNEIVTRMDAARAISQPEHHIPKRLES